MILEREAIFGEQSLHPVLLSLPDFFIPVDFGGRDRRSRSCCWSFVDRLRLGLGRDDSIILGLGLGFRTKREVRCAFTVVICTQDTNLSPLPESASKSLIPVMLLLVRLLRSTVLTR